MKKSEVLKDLITLAFDSDPDDIKISLSDALDLYAEILLREQDSGPAEPAEKKINTGDNSTAPRGDLTPIERTGGKGAAEKKDIYGRLLAYRKKNGLGCLKSLVETANGAITEDEIRAMIDGEAKPLPKWQVLGAALAACGG